MVSEPSEDFKKRYPHKEWEWINITGYLVGTGSLAENKAVPGNAFLPLANIQLTTEVKADGNRLTDCQNIIAGPVDNEYWTNNAAASEETIRSVNFWNNGALYNEPWRNSVFNCIVDCTEPGDAVAINSISDSEKYSNGRGLRVNFVRWDGRLCQEYSVLIDKDYDNTERWKQRFSDSQIVTKPFEFISEAQFLDWSYLLPSGSYHPENGIVAYPRIDKDFRREIPS